MVVAQYQTSSLGPRAKRSGRSLFILLALLAYLVIGKPPQPALAAGLTYYVDCSAGNDSNSGTTPSQAWKSLAKANVAPLGPGDSLLFKRDCTWSGTFRAKWVGTATSPVTISAYGSGALPLIQDGQYYTVDIVGSYQNVEYLQTTLSTPPNPDPNCKNQPVGWRVGFSFRSGAAYNTLRYSKATKFTIGVNLATNSHHNRVLNNTITDNQVMQVLTPQTVNASDDLGAWGIALHGDDQEVAYNYLANNNAICIYDVSTPHGAATPHGNSVEVYEARRASIHHNTAVNDRDFAEFSGSATLKSADNVVAYNLIVSNFPDAHFIIVRGSGNPIGPTFRTTVYNNTVYLTGSGSQGVVCHAGCNSEILTLQNNILWAEWKAIYADGVFTESNNLYWHRSGLPFPNNFVQLLNGATLSPSSQQVDPQFVDPAALNFRLKSASPALNKGSSEAVNRGWNKDLDGVLVPQGGTADVGGYEYKDPTLTTATVNPYGDAYVDSAYPAQNYGTEVSLASDASPSIMIAYLKFNLTSYAGVNLSSAKLKLKVVDSSSSVHNLKLAANDVREAEMTYNKRASLGATLATINGAQAGTWIELDITDAVRSTLGQRLYLAIDTTGVDQLRVASRESAKDKPQLVLQYR